jgi:2-oxoglutarate dehydrogenase E2 component (dihydrolipoamide succinyltransferase)
VVNASVEGEDILYHDYYDIGVAVSTERGLVVPVLRGADAAGLRRVEAGIADFAARARDAKLTMEDLDGGTFTITNGGVFGSLLSTPILNPPQSAVLGMHKIQERPVAEQGQVVVRPMMYLALSYDHRLIDGRDAVQFLVAMKENARGSCASAAATSSSSAPARPAIPARSARRRTGSRRPASTSGRTTTAATPSEEPA